MILIFSMLFILLGYAGWRLTARSAYESASYAVLETDGSIEIRNYPDLKLATTEMKLAAQGNDGSFMRLFDYISGGNQDEQKVAMTTPVFMRPESTDEPGQMGFVLPEKVANSEVPEPSSSRVKMKTRPGGNYAVIRFSGRLNGKLIEQKTEALQEWIESRNLKTTGEIEVAGYDAPWTPGLLRRNEVMIRLVSEF